MVNQFSVIFQHVQEEICLNKHFLDACVVDNLMELSELFEKD